MTTSHLSNVTDQWQREGIILKRRKGREIELGLTKKGKELVKILSDYDSLFKKEFEREEENE